MGFDSPNCATPVVDKLETIDDLLNQLFNLSDIVATANFRIANAVAGVQQVQASGNTAPATPIESSVLARLQAIKRIIAEADRDAFRAKSALGLQ